MKVIPATLQTAYANLLQAHLNRPAFEFDGAPFLRKLGNKSYWYANQRAAPGAPARQRYLGPDNENMRARIEQMRTQQQTAADFRTYTSSLVAQLRAGGIPGPDRKTGPMLRVLTNSGVFRLGGTLVGTHAFRHYDLVLGVHLTEAADWIAGTDDIDVASFARLSMAIQDSADPGLANALGELGFRPAPTLNHKTPTSWVLADGSYAIDFLTPSFGEAEQPVRLAALEMWAQSLHFLNYLIADPVPAASPYMEGLLIQIPRPERYAVHKLIVAQRRHAGADGKRRKDIEQARAIIWAMSEDRPFELGEAIREADSNGEKWKAALDRSLDLQIAADEPKLAGDSAEFSGRALGQKIKLRISGSALVQLFGGDGDSLMMAKANRAAIELLFRRQFRRQPAPDILLATYNLPDPV